MHNCHSGEGGALRLKSYKSFQILSMRAGYVREGAMAYLARQYKVVIKVFIVRGATRCPGKAFSTRRRSIVALLRIPLHNHNKQNLQIKLPLENISKISHILGKNILNTELCTVFWATPAAIQTENFGIVYKLFFN